MRGKRGYHNGLLGRRDVLVGACAALGSARCFPGPGALPTALAGGAPDPSWGIKSGDIDETSAVVWSRADRSSRMVVEWSTSASFAGARQVVGPIATGETDFAAKVALTGLPAGTRIHYRARFEAERASDWIVGTLRTAPVDARDVVFAFSGDTNGQGWGIDPARGGMPAYAAALDRAPDFFVHLGDQIYADDPILPAIALPDGGSWNNVVTPAKSRVAESLDDYRGAFLYPRHAPQVRALSAAAPEIAIWDDHEVRDNWFPTQTLDDPRYVERSIDVLASRARRAMYEHAPTLRDPSRPMYRSMRWGPHLEVFLLDGRSHRSRNWPSVEEARFFGDAQIAWLTDALTRSRATWKVVACDVPLGLVIPDNRAPGGQQAFDAIADGAAGAPLGRELELARLFGALAQRSVRNVVWLAAEVHYAAAHRYDPARAAVKELVPFWEFVAGPMHAASFPRRAVDDTFGIEVAYASADGTTIGSPAAGVQSFGVARIDGKTRALTVTLVDGRGRDLYTTVLEPE